MAIRRHNTLEHVDGSYFAGASLVDKEKGIGVVVPVGSTGTGAAGDSINIVELPTPGAGEQFVGVLMSEVVTWDRTKCCFLPEKYRSATTVCRPVNIVRQGDVFTDQLKTGDAPATGAPAYVGADGKFTVTSNALGQVGTFRGVKDSNGFVSIHIDK